MTKTGFDAIINDIYHDSVRQNTHEKVQSYMGKSETMTPAVTEHIIDSTIEVLAKKTISGTRMHLIADEAGMGASNIHYYYKTKKDLLYAVLTEIQHRSTLRREGIMKDAGTTLEGKMAGFFESKATLIRQDPHADTIQFDFWVQGLSDDPELKERVNNSFEIWRSDIKQVLGEHAPGMSDEKKEMLAHIMVSMMMGASMQYHNCPNPMDLDVYFDYCLKMILDQI